MLRLIRILAWVLLLGGALLFAQGSFIHAKALVAQQLLQFAWQQSQQQGEPVRPWPWADGYPIARLQIPRIKLDQLVLAGSSGRNLAFAPTHLLGSAAPNSGGTTVLSAHRDTHFEGLQELVPGDRLTLQGPNGERHYRVESMSVADSRHQELSLDAGDRLLLVTCYPFDALQAGGPLRYVVNAVPIPQAIVAATGPEKPRWFF
ncbi:class GN sortase [Aestuariirhabdus sp. Z084]|uniref:class GN sortase n=1 Tax=Aestuariirhabdus haliotis TaxID=2918751 RepID=UPI00201B3AA0|nr:class GN sortase [Aestuariirhabdus haliotis]MCL6415261.1 class GN sortase [Aestuariirhabdus haliotis]MCL6419521.1 class GN sortase [Aestuariirhabdus haliotis]